MAQTKRKARKRRALTSLSKDEQVAHLLGIADSKQVERIPHEAQLGQLERMPEEERIESGNPDADWATVRKREADALDRLDAEAKAAEQRALELNGKPLTAKARKERRERVSESRRRELEQNLRNFEAQMLGHETHLHRLELIPENQRDEDWEAEFDQHEEALDVIERAVEVANALLNKERRPA